MIGKSYNTISSYVNSKLFMVRDSIRRHSALRLQTQNLQERNLSDTMMSDYLHTKTIQVTIMYMRTQSTMPISVTTQYLKFMS